MRNIAVMVAMVGMLVLPAWAVLVQNMTTGDVLFYDDFESPPGGDGVNPDNGGYPGNWVLNESGTSIGYLLMDVLNNPGFAYRDNQYFSHAKIPGHGTSEALAMFSSPQTTAGDVIHVEFATYRYSQGASNYGCRVRLEDATGNKASELLGYYGAYGNLKDWPPTVESIPCSQDSWHVLAFDYTIGGTAFTVTVDNGPPVAMTSAAALTSVDRLYIDSGNTNIAWAMDDVRVPGTIAWADDTSGDWRESTNWNVGGVPDGNTHTAIFGSAITSTRVVYIEGAVTVKSIRFDNANTYQIAGGSVNLEADSGNASLDVDQGDHEFQARVNLNSNTDADVAAGASVTFTNVLTLSGNTLTKTGDGTLSINNKLNAGGGSVVGLAGTISGDGSVGGDLTNTSATVAPGNSPGTLTVEGNFSQAAGGTLAIELAGTAAGEFDVLEVVGSASLGGSLDISELYTPGGADTWTILTAGGGITGSFDAITAGYQVALANGDTELVLSLGGALLPGDANGDGCVDDLDLTALAVHWQQSTNLWEDGDFNGDGIVDDLDLTALAVNWQQGCGGGGSFADALATNGVIPEPATLSLFALAGVGLLRRRS